MNFETEFTRLRETRLKEFEKEQKMTFSRALLGGSAWFLTELPEEEESAEISQAETEEVAKEVVEEDDFNPLSEKSHLFESLEKFAKKETESKVVGEKIISLEGGQVEVKEDETSYVELKCSSTESFKSQLEGIEVLNQNYSGVKCLFLGDTPHVGEDDLLMKMIGAMKLETGEYLRMPLDNISQDSDEFGDLCLGLKIVNPEVIVTMGAVATNVMLGKKERLSRVHGELRDKTVKFSDGVTLSYKMIPIFHPDYLKINPKMKRTAWSDLQKVMKLIGKM
ncbi:MAG: hypothetical protein KC493_03355 [Bacteriovoracaceae bacterium]|nr:hypothetical protein [Bacteriovoracaceae bacterium]